MIDLEHCLILGREAIDSNSLNRCIYNLFTKMGEFNTSFINASSENVPESPFFSGGYQNALTDIPYVKELNNHGGHAVKATKESEGLLTRLYKGNININDAIDTSSFMTESVTGAYEMTNDMIEDSAPTVESLMREKNPLILKSFVDEESQESSYSSTIETATSPTIKYTSYMLNSKTGISFGTITFSRNNGETQKNEISIDIKSELIGINGVDYIRFFTVGNGFNSGVKTISENCDMVTDMGTCSVTYNSNSDIVISNITKNDDGDQIVIDNETGRILDSDEEYDYSKCTVIENNTSILNFFIIFELKDNVIEYSDDLWCFYIVDSQEHGIEKRPSAEGWAENYTKYTFSKFEAADDGMELEDGTHFVWTTTDEKTGGCTYNAVDAFRNCYNGTFESLRWFSPRLRDASRMFQNCKKATFASFPTEFELDDLKRGTRMFDHCEYTTFSKLGKISLPNASDISYMFSNCFKSTFISLGELTIAGNAEHMFDGDYIATFNNLETIGGNAYNFTSMFEGCDNANFGKLSVLSSGTTNGNASTKRMFYGLRSPKFDRLKKIDITTESGYDGTSMFESCTSATFANLESLGNVKNGTRMFANLDQYDETEYMGQATFSNLKDIGSKLENGTEMFQNNRFMAVEFKTPDITVENGTSMFQNTSSIIIDGNMNSLTIATDMFSQVETAVMRGDANSLKNGTSMFSYCTSADLSGTIDSMVNMDSMFQNTTHANINQVPETATLLSESFANIGGHCYVNEWMPSTELRNCWSAFEKSSNVWINGNILDGSIYATDHMFDGCTGVYLNNPEMSGNSANTGDRYFAVDSDSYFAFLQNYDEDNYGSFSPKMTFIGSCTDTDEYSSFALSSYAESADVSNSVLCFEKQDYDGNTTFYVYTVSKPYEYGESTVTLHISSIELNTGDSATVYTLNSDGTSGEYYGTIESKNDGTTLSVTFKKNTDDTYSFKSLNTNPSMEYSESEKPQVQTFTTVDSIVMTDTWKTASYMFHDVVQSCLLSGYDCFLSDSLCDTESMFELSNYVENDETFSKTGNIFRKMRRSSIQNMKSMFRNRYISNPSIFTDNYLDDYNCNISLMIPYSVVDASSAYQNCCFNTGENIPYVYVDIPTTLVGASCMFDSLSGTKLKLNYDNDEWIYLNDAIVTDNMFRNCSFYNESMQRYKISSPSIYLQVFNKSDFDMNDVTELEFRNEKNLASAYDENTRFFFNDDKILGCSSMTFSSLENDITDWFNSSGTTTTNALNVECVYLATVVGPSNELDENGKITKNYELMTGVKSGTSWNVNMSEKGQFTGEMMNALLESTNSVLMDSVTALDDADNRMTCMFNPSSLFLFSDTNSRLGDSLYSIMGNSDYSKVSLERSGTIGGKLRSCSNKTYRNVTLNSVQSIDAQEMPLAFMGMESATFNSLTTIGDDMLNAYGAFMFCGNATFDNLTSISVMQYDSEDTFSCRYADTAEERNAWFGNYNNMFFEDQKATFENLKTISFNTVNGMDSNGNPVSIWFDSDRSLLYSIKSSSGSITIYQCEIFTYTNNEDKNIYYAISIKDYVGNSLTGKSSTVLKFYTDVVVHDNFEVTYELDEIDSVISVVMTIIDGNNQNHYYIANSYKIYESPMHPINGYAEYDGKNFVVTPFLSSGEGYKQSFVSLDGFSYELETVRDDDIEGVYTIDLKDSINGTVMKLGSAYVGDDIDDMYMSRLLYESDGISYIAITLFKSSTTPSSPITYPSDCVCYRIYEYGGDHYVDELSVIPGTIDFKNLITIGDTVETVLSHKAFCSGMFKNCTNATFDSLKTINIPMSGSCAEMFANCTSINLSGNSLDSLVLPIAYSYPSDYDHECYKKMFSGISTDRVKLDSLNVNNTNIYKIGKKVNGNSHHLIGEQLFDGMIIPISDKYGKTTGETRTANVSSNGDAFTYQNAIFDLDMDSELASNIFDRGNYYTVKFYDRLGSLIRTTEVEYATVSGNSVQYPVQIPPYTTYSSPFSGWQFVNENGKLEVMTTSSATYYGPITKNLSAFPIYVEYGNEQISAHKLCDTDSMSAIIYHNDETTEANKILVTSYQADRG